MSKSQVFKTLSRIFALACGLLLALVCMFNYWNSWSLGRRSLPTGEFTQVLGFKSTAGQPRGVNICTVSDGTFWMTLLLTISGANLRGDVDFVRIESLAEPLMFREKNSSDVFEIKDEQVYRRTGNLRWRFNGWSIVGGSAVSLTYTYLGGTTPAFAFTAVQPILRPSWVATILLLMSGISWLVARASTRRLEGARPLSDQSERA